MDDIQSQIRDPQQEVMELVNTQINKLVEYAINTRVGFVLLDENKKLIWEKKMLEAKILDFRKKHLIMSEEGNLLPTYDEHFGIIPKEKKSVQ